MLDHGSAALHRTDAANKHIKPFGNDFSGLFEDTLLSGGVSLRGLMFWQLDFLI